MEIHSTFSRLVFDDVRASINKKEIIHGVSGIATGGEVLAIMGPTGSGKTTLLNVLAGHLPHVSGSITWNGIPLQKVSRLKVAYVIQNDVFLTNLTLYETLYFTAMLRIPDSIPHREKLTRIEEIVNALNIKGCMNTVIGTFLERGLSGGEKKRASIACELLTDPDIMLIDEPTTGLDSSTADKLMQQLKNFASKHNKTVITTIHQPSSQVYHLFSKLLLLEKGQTAYFGKASDAVRYFENLGFPCQPDFNPADHCLELLTSDKSVISAIRQSPLKLSYFLDESNGHDTGESSLRGPDKSIGNQSKTSHSNVYTIEFSNASLSTDMNTHETDCASKHLTKRWPTNFWAQYKILTWRNYRQAKGRIIDRVTTIQALIVGLVGGLIYFQIPDSLNTFRDRMGLLFAAVLHWGMQIAVVTIIGFPGEREVVIKERRAGAYRLSAYYLAKISSELPLLAIIPILFYSGMYWMAMLGDVSQFFIFLGITLMSCLCIQGIGHIIGALIVNNKDAMVISHTTTVTFILLAGFYTTHLTPDLNWMKYFSLFHYPIAAMATLILADKDSFPCNETSLETFKLCEKSEFVSKDELLTSYGIDIPVHCCLSMLGILIIVAKIFGYFALRWKHI